MLLEVAGGLIIGLLLGIVTGLLPGVHINLVSAFIVASSFLAELTSSLMLVSCIVSLAITHTVIDFIPSIYLGAPTDDTILSVLPGHELLRQGKGHEAVVVALYGTLASIGIIAILTPLFILFAEQVQEKITPIIPFLLVGISLYIIAREEKPLAALTVFVLAGLLGITTLNVPVQEPLLPLLTGLFGISGMLTSLNNKEKMPDQKEIRTLSVKISRKELRDVAIAAIVAAPLGSFLPAIGSGYAALIGNEIKSLSKKAFLFLNGLLNMTLMVMSFVLVYAAAKARTGAAAAIQELVGTITKQQITIILITSVIVLIAACAIGTYLSKKSAYIISRIPYKIVSIITIALVITLVSIFSGKIGIIVLITATGLGLFTIDSNVKRTTMMGCLIVPTILYYFA